MESGYPGVPFHPQPDSGLHWSELRLGKAEEEPYLQGELDREVLVSVTELTIWCLDQPVTEVHEDLESVVRQSSCERFY